MTLKEAENIRYHRQMILPEVGIRGQTALKEAKVLIVGLGGLGSPAAVYLASAGVGTLGLVDFDRVTLSNLQRQILYTAEQSGEPKSTAAAEFLERHNPHIQLCPYQEKLSLENAKRIFQEYDIILDGTDNFATRYLINDTCIDLQKPFVYGSIFHFEGQVSLFWPDRSAKVPRPCYRCLYPTTPSGDLAPTCAEAGVLGVLPGIIGILQAGEVLKWILKKGKGLTGRLLCFDLLQGSFKEISFPAKPGCLCAGGVRYSP